MKRAVYLILLILALIAPAVWLAGCTTTAVDDTSKFIEGVRDNPITGHIPFVPEGAAIALAGLALWREILRRKQLRAVARSVNPAIQAAPEVVKEGIKYAQGPALSALMKRYRGS